MGHLARMHTSIVEGNLCPQRNLGLRGALRDIPKPILYPELQKDLVRLACFFKPIDSCKPFLSFYEDEKLQFITD